MDRKIDCIVWHTSATKESSNIGVDELRRMHKARGWSDVGYHIIVQRNGNIQIGRPIEKIGAGVYGFNKHAVHLVWIGGLKNDGKTIVDNRSESQKASMIAATIEMKKSYPNAKVIGHRDFSPDLNGDGKITSNEWIKQCPCFDAMEEYKWI